MCLELKVGHNKTRKLELFKTKIYDKINNKYQNKIMQSI